MNRLTIKGKTYQIPSAFSELTLSQAKSLILLSFSNQSEVTQAKAFARIVPKNIIPVIRKMTNAQVYDLLQLTSFVWNDYKVHKPIASFSWKGTDYLLPESDLSNVTVIEYAKADQYLVSFAKGKAIDLDKLIATLCRPARPIKETIPETWDGDRRVKYNSAHAESNALLFEKMPIETKLLVLHYFISLKKHIQEKQYKRLYVVIQEGEGGSGVLNLGFIGIIFELAEQGIFGDFEKTAHTNLHTVCVYLLKKLSEKPVTAN